MNRACLPFLSFLAVAHAATVQETTPMLFDAARRADTRAAVAAIQSGAEVNARNPLGQTPLILAAAQPGGDLIVKLLLERGADPNIADKTPSITPNGVFSGGNTALIEAARVRDGKSLRLLIAAKAGVNGKNAHGGTPIAYAILHGNIENARALAAAGADVNIKMDDGTTPLMLALQREDVPATSLVLDRGADISSADMAGNTPLMWAAYSETGKPELVRMLLAKGATIDTRNKANETALDWARRRGNTVVVDELTRAAAAKLSKDAIRAAAEKPLQLLQTSGIQFFKVSGCASCHHQSLPAMALKAAAEQGIAINADLQTQQRKMVNGFLKPVGGLLPVAPHSVPDAPSTLSYLLLGILADDPNNEGIPAIVSTISGMQREDGSWAGMAPRPPLSTATDLDATSIALIALTSSGRANKGTIANAVQWLSTQKTSVATSRALRLWALGAANAPTAELMESARTLRAAQRPDGGWNSVPGLDSDAFATALALNALRVSGAVKPSDESYRRGIVYLLDTQLADGTWHVKTRAFPLQPYKESGFPHAKDQWISASATSYAVMALTAALPTL